MRKFISDSQIAEVKENAHIEAVVGDFCDLHRSGRGLVALCPFHSEKTPSLKVDAEKGVFYCFGCGASGDVISFVMRIENLSFQEAVQALADRSGVSIGLMDLGKIADKLTAPKEAYRKERDGDLRPKSNPLPPEFIPCYDGETWRLPFYLTKDRNVSRETIQRFGLGYCETGDYAGRVIIPIETKGETTFVARLIDDRPGLRGPKYRYPDGSTISWYLFNSPRIDLGSPLVLAEGVFDVMRLESMGYPAIGLLGKQMSISQERKILQKEPSQVWVMLDSDAFPKACEIAQRLENGGIPAEVVEVPEGKDPDSMSQSEIQRALIGALAPYQAAMGSMIMRENGVSRL